MTSPNYSGRIERRFAHLRHTKRAGLITFITAGDPDPETCAKLLRGLPAAGADLIELGMPFSDPIADGPTIQASSQRALRGGVTLEATLGLAADFRRENRDTPLILMGYCNPIYRFGAERFNEVAARAGVDGLIVVDLPPEEDHFLGECITDLALIKMATPTTDSQRLPAVLHRSRGFLYYATIKGITGAGSAFIDDTRTAVTQLARHTDLPIAVGFGIRTAEQAAAAAGIADGVVVGSAIVERIAAHLDDRSQLVDHTLTFVGDLARAIAAV